MRKTIEETKYVTQKKRVVICDDCGTGIHHDGLQIGGRFNAANVLL